MGGGSARGGIEQGWGLRALGVGEIAGKRRGGESHVSVGAVVQAGSYQAAGTLLDDGRIRHARTIASYAPGGIRREHADSTGNPHVRFETKLPKPLKLSTRTPDTALSELTKANPP